MIVLDTNVISELVRREPDPNVVDWLDGQDLQTLATTSITVGELRYGIELLPHGNRRKTLEEAISVLLTRLIDERVLPFSTDAALAYGVLAAIQKRRGIQAGTHDTMIAATAISSGHTLATRNVRDFAECGIDLVNPWAAE